MLSERSKLPSDKLRRHDKFESLNGVQSLLGVYFARTLVDGRNLEQVMSLLVYRLHYRLQMSRVGHPGNDPRKIEDLLLQVELNSKGTNAFGHIILFPSLEYRAPCLN